MSNKSTEDPKVEELSDDDLDQVQGGLKLGGTLKATLNRPEDSSSKLDTGNVKDPA